MGHITVPSNEHQNISIYLPLVQADRKYQDLEPLDSCEGNDRVIPLTKANKYSLLMHCIKIKSPAKFLLNEQYVFVGGNIYFLCVLSFGSKRHSQLDYELNGL